MVYSYAFNVFKNGHRFRIDHSHTATVWWPVYMCRTSSSSSSSSRPRRAYHWVDAVVVVVFAVGQHKLRIIHTHQLCTHSTSRIEWRARCAYARPRTLKCHLPRFNGMCIMNLNTRNISPYLHTWVWIWCSSYQIIQRCVDSEGGGKGVGRMQHSMLCGAMHKYYPTFKV